MKKWFFRKYLETKIRDANICQKDNYEGKRKISRQMSLSLRISLYSVRRETQSHTAHTHPEVCPGTLKGSKGDLKTIVTLTI